MGEQKNKNIMVNSCTSTMGFLASLKGDVTKQNSFSTDELNLTKRRATCFVNTVCARDKFSIARGMCWLFTMAHYSVFFFFLAAVRYLRALFRRRRRVLASRRPKIPYLRVRLHTYEIILYSRCAKKCTRYEFESDCEKSKTEFA